jgi:hypothetical protein
VDGGKGLIGADSGINILVGLANVELTIFYPEDGGIMFLKNIGAYIPDYTVPIFQII